MKTVIYPECFADEVFLKKVFFVHPKFIQKQHNKPKVLRSIRENNRDICLGFVDRDNELKHEKLTKEFNQVIYKSENVIISSTTENTKFLISLIPALEKFIVKLLSENNFNLEDFNFTDIEDLQSQLKSISVENNARYITMLKAIRDYQSEDLLRIKQLLMEFNTLMN